jgi:1-phosphatidylinositol-3-phosphate 5-kinase
VCKFCFENIDHNIMESNSAAALGMSPADTVIFEDFSPVVPDQKAPIAAPKLQISTTALKRSRDSYGAQNTPTVSVEFQNEFVTEKPVYEEDFSKIPDLLSPNDNPLVRQTHRLSEYDDHEPRPTRTESSSSIRPRLRSSTSGSFGSGDENVQSVLSQKSPFPFRSELGSPALEAVPNRASSEFGGSPLIDKYEDENEDGGVAWNHLRNSSAVDLPPNAYASYKLLEPGSPSLEKDVKGNEGSAAERPIYKYSDAATKSKHKMNRRLNYTVDERKSTQSKGSPVLRNMKKMKVNTHNLTLPMNDSPRSDDPAPSEDQFMLFSPFHRSEQPNWPSPDLLLNNSRSPSQSATSASNSIQMHSELSIASLDHLRKLLHTSLTDLKYMQDNPALLPKYEHTLFDLVLEMVISIKPDVRGGDDMDLRHYLKIKKIPGAKPSDSHYVKGVVCSKNVAHKQMIRNVDDPRILILLFPVEYSRVGNQLLSLEPVLSQEKEHLKKLVARIIALKPSIVLTKFNVSRLAMEYLLAENIIVVHNMKKSVLQAIARCTGASLIPSIDKFPSGDISLGHCGRFEIKTLVHEMIPNRKKTYLLFDQCSAELGGTIVLRGADQLTLGSIKRIVDFMCYVANSLKLETCLLRDSFAKSKIRADPGNMGSNTETTRLRRASDSLLSLPSLLISEADNASQTPPAIPLENTPPHISQTINGLGITEVEQRHRSIDGSIEMYREALVSISPFVVVPPPYLLTKIKEVEVKILEMEHLMAQEETNHDHVLTPGSTTPVNATFDQKQEANFISHTIVHVDSGTSPLKDELDLLLDQRHQLTRAWYASMPDMFSHLTAYHHQHLVVLYFNVCTATTVPCHGPEPLFFQYYNQNSDITLGHYLEDLCGNSQRICSSSMCERSEMLHYRSYVHGQARINVMIEKFECPQPGMNDIILMWSYCQRCNNPTPVVPMSQNTWNYSFGKFLELSLYQADVQCRADICPHDIARDHVRYFGFKDLAVRFQYDEIDLLEVAPPPMKLVMFTKVHSKLREDQYQTYRSKIAAFYQSIIERNKHFNMDILDPTKVDAAKKELTEMSENAAAEKMAMLQALQSVYATTYSTDILSLNQLVFHFFRSASAWDQAYSYLLRKYLPQDTDIGKIASSGLRKLLPSDKVIDIDARAERAIDTGDLPVLDVGLDSLPLSIASDAHFTFTNEDNHIHTVPALGASPPERQTGAARGEVVDSQANQDGIVLPSRLARRLSIGFIRTENERAAAEEKQSKMIESSLPLIDPVPSSIMARRQAKGMPKRPSHLTDWKNRPSSIPSFLTLTEHGIGSSIRRKEHPIFLLLQDSSILVNTPPDVNSPGQMASNHQGVGEIMMQSRETGHRVINAPPLSIDGISRSPYSYLPRYADQLSKGSIRDMQKVTPSRRKWGPKLERSRTSIQVYDTANDLVQEDVEQEFGDDPATCNAFGNSGDGGGATVSSRLGKIDPLLSNRLLAASHYRQVEPRTDYFDNARIRDSDRVVNTPVSPRSITNFFLDAASTDQHLTNHSDHQAPLSSSPTLAPPKEEEDINSDVSHLTLTSSGASSPNLLKQQQNSSLLDDHPPGGSDQTMFMKALSTALAEITFSKLPPLEYPL